jgi:hypothetical protein
MLTASISSGETVSWPAVNLATTISRGFALRYFWCISGSKAVRLIERALAIGKIRKEHFLGPSKRIALRDDAWLLGILRSLGTKGDATFRRIKEAALLNTREDIATLWRRRARYKRYHDQVINEIAQLRDVSPGDVRFEISDDAAYERHLTSSLGMPVLYVPLEFNALGREHVRLYSAAERFLRKETLEDVSPLVRALRTMWNQGDPKRFVILVQPDIRAIMGTRQGRDDMCKRWAGATVEYLAQLQ